MACRTHPGWETGSGGSGIGGLEEAEEAEMKAANSSKPAGDARITGR